MSRSNVEPDVTGGRSSRSKPGRCPSAGAPAARASAADPGHVDTMKFPTLRLLRRGSEQQTRARCPARLRFRDGPDVRGDPSSLAGPVRVREEMRPARAFAHIERYAYQETPGR